MASDRERPREYRGADENRRHERLPERTNTQAPWTPLVDPGWRDVCLLHANALEACMTPQPPAPVGGTKSSSPPPEVSEKIRRLVEIAGATNCRLGVELFHPDSREYADALAKCDT